MAKKSKNQIKELYSKNGLRIVMYQHENGSRTFRAAYKGHPNNIKSHLHQALSHLQENSPDLTPNETLEGYLRRTEDTKYVDDLGTVKGEIILGAYVPLQDRFYLRRDIPKGLISIVEQYLKNNNKSPNNVKKKIIKFRDTHEAGHRRRHHTGETQSEKEVDLEAAVASEEYPIIRFPEILTSMSNPSIREKILNRPGIEYVKRAA